MAPLDGSSVAITLIQAILTAFFKKWIQVN